MDSRAVVFALGSHDPEMRQIRRMLSKAGYCYVLANRFGRRCISGNAYKADSLSKSVMQDQQIVWVECRSSVYCPERDLIVDHHNPGDPGYSSPPSEYWEGSSIGQVAMLIGGRHEDFKLVAASDHCLSAAMRGECKGIDPSELMSWRISARAAMAEIQPWLLRCRIERALERVQLLPRLSFGGETIVDASFDPTPELRDAAALAGLPIMTTRTNSVGQVKVGLYGASPDVVTSWLVAMNASPFVEHTYGNPYREYAGAVLSIDASERMLAANCASLKSKNRPCF